MEPAACAEEYCWNTTRLTAKRASVTVCVCVGSVMGREPMVRRGFQERQGMWRAWARYLLAQGKGCHQPVGGEARQHSVDASLGGLDIDAGNWFGSNTQNTTPQVSSPATSQVVAPVLTIEVQAVVSGALRYLVSCQKPSQVTAAAGPGVASSWLGNPRWRTRLAASHSTSVESPAACWLPPLG